MDYSIAEGKNCAECRHSSTWPGYAKSFMVCNNPSVVLKLGGPRSVRDLVRSPGGICSPEGKLFEKPKVNE